ncbi:MAG: chemotaxis protein CheC [Candidatus Omnitrophota bacterium]
MDMVQFNEKQLDAVREIGTIGSGHAALALSQMIGKRVNIAVVKVELVPSNEFDKLVGGPDTLGASIYLQILGDLRGSVILFFKRLDALRLVDTLLAKEKNTTVMLSEIGISALKEAGNILTGSYLSAMSQIIAFKMALSVPRLAFDLIGFVMEGIYSEVMQPEKKSLALVTEFIESTSQIKGYFVFLPKKESWEKIIEGLKV